MTSPLLEWRPIDTAPKDGTRVLLSDGVTVWTSFWSDWGGQVKARWEPEGDADPAALPTYWMPFPPPPKAERSP